MLEVKAGRNMHKQAAVEQLYRGSIVSIDILGSSISMVVPILQRYRCRKLILIVYSLNLFYFNSDYIEIRKLWTFAFFCHIAIGQKSRLWLITDMKYRM